MLLKSYQQFCDTVKNLWGLNINIVSNIDIIETQAEIDSSTIRHENIGGDTDEE